MGPTFNLKKKKETTNKKQLISLTRKEGWIEGVRVYFFFPLKSSFFDSRVSDRRISSGQTRKVLYATRATCGNQKQGISSRIQVKIRKNPSF